MKNDVQRNEDGKFKIVVVESEAVAKLRKFADATSSEADDADSGEAIVAAIYDVGAAIVNAIEDVTLAIKDK